MDVLFFKKIKHLNDSICINSPQRNKTKLLTILKQNFYLKNILYIQTDMLIDLTVYTGLV